MSQDISYLTLEQILVIHQDQIDRYGGSHGLRDLTLLESAVLRPQTTFSGDDLYPTIFDKAAVLLHSIVNNHAFTDGNKRTAAASTIIFLMQNGYELRVSNKDLVKTVLAATEKNLSFENISQWLEKNSTSL